MENEIRCVQRVTRGICDRKCENCKLVRKDEPLIESYGVAILAIEKQIAKKPYYRKEEDSEGYACPVCDIGVTVDHGRIKLSYCSSCGQRLDWSD